MDGLTQFALPSTALAANANGEGIEVDTPFPCDAFAKQVRRILRKGSIETFDLVAVTKAYHILLKPSMNLISAKEDAKGTLVEILDQQLEKEVRRRRQRASTETRKKRSKKMAPSPSPPSHPEFGLEDEGENGTFLHATLTAEPADWVREFTAPERPMNVEMESTRSPSPNRGVGTLPLESQSCSLYDDE